MTSLMYNSHDRSKPGPCDVGRDLPLVGRRLIRRRPRRHIRVDTVQRVSGWLVQKLYTTRPCQSFISHWPFRPLELRGQVSACSNRQSFVRSFCEMLIFHAEACTLNSSHLSF